MARAGYGIPWHDLRRTQTRLQLSLFLGVLALLCLRLALPLSTALIGAWDAAALGMLGSAWWIIARADHADTRERAGADDPGRRALLLLSLASSLVSFFAAALLIQHVEKDDRALRALSVSLCLAAPMLAWLLTHSVYALHYAHLYYGAHGEGEGLSFPGAQQPNDLDFAYFAFTIGMTFQTSDVAITSQRVRRSVLLHSLLSFVFNTGVIALALNLALGKLL